VNGLTCTSCGFVSSEDLPTYGRGKNLFCGPCEAKSPARNYWREANKVARQVVDMEERRSARGFGNRDGHGDVLDMVEKACRGHAMLSSPAFVGQVLELTRNYCAFEKDTGGEEPSDGERAFYAFQSDALEQATALAMQRAVLRGDRPATPYSRKSLQLMIRLQLGDYQ